MHWKLELEHHGRKLIFSGICYLQETHYLHVVSLIHEWLCRLIEAVGHTQCEVVNALVLLMTHCLWLERNNSAFDKFTTMFIKNM
jgi:hypothetical protein